MANRHGVFIFFVTSTRRRRISGGRRKRRRWWGGRRGRRSGKTREISLVKLCTCRDYGFASDGIIEGPTLILSWIPNEDAFLHVGGEPSALVLLDMHICSAAKDTEVRYIWDLVEESSEGDAAIESRGGGTVVDMDECVECVAPI